jgi:hypothetical protein
MLHSVYWVVTDVSGKPVCPNNADRLYRNVDKYPPFPDALTSQRNEDLQEIIPQGISRQELHSNKTQSHDYEQTGTEIQK